MRNGRLLTSGLALFVVAGGLVAACSSSDPATPLGTVELPLRPADGSADSGPGAGVRDISSFLACLNRNAAGQNVSAAVQCLPPGCSFLLTMSTESAQKACVYPASGAQCQMPRVIFSCGSPALMPSFLLCPTGSTQGGQLGSNRVEVGMQLSTSDSNMEMADIPFPPSGYQSLPLTPSDGGGANALSMPPPPGSKRCNRCHDAVTVDGSPGTGPNGGLLSGTFPADPSLVIYNSAGGANPDAATAQSLSQVCNCIKCNSAINAPAPDASADAGASQGQIVNALCQALLGYAGQPDLPCGDAGDAADASDAVAPDARDGSSAADSTPADATTIDAATSGEATTGDDAADEAATGDDADASTNDAGMETVGAASACSEATNAPGCFDPAVQSCVCAQDSYCCYKQWDGVCAEESVACPAASAN
jgi:hypothetical protein